MTEPSADQVEEYEAAVHAAAESEAAAAADVRELVSAVRVGQAVIRPIIDDLQAEKDRARAILATNNPDIGPRDTKELARAVIRLADSSIDLARVIRDMSRVPDNPVPPV